MENNHLLFPGRWLYLNSLRAVNMDFSGGPVVEIPRFRCRGHAFDPWSEGVAWPGWGGTNISHRVAWQEKKPEIMESSVCVSHSAKSVASMVSFNPHCKPVR